MLRTRLATAAVALPALWLIIQYLWTPLFNGFIVSVAAVALYEYFTMAFPDDSPMVAVGVGLGLLIAATVLTGQLAWVGGALSVTVIGGLALPLVRHADMRRSVEALGLIVLGVLYVGFFVPHMILLRQEPEGWRWVLFTVYTAMGSDSGGYFAGRYFGRRKLAPAISPSKTVEGALGAVAGAIVIALFCRAMFFDRMALGPTIGFALGIGLLAQFGDLCESALKRAFGAKDSGWIIPGHGGILDRLDSLLFPFVFAYYYAAVVARG
ncbi:MAG: phosphatidate cytidylyltransferase [bacterium]|nr:phosphatidate cytidylyltransferase [bacterium]